MLPQTSGSIGWHSTEIGCAEIKKINKIKHGKGGL